MSAHPESYGHWDHAQISELLHERDRLRASERSAWNAAVERDEKIERLRAEVAAKEKFVKDAIAACSNAGRLLELLRDVAASGVEYEALRYFVIQIDKSTWLDVKAALGEEKKDEA